jgi:hypothetical protein
MLNRHTLHRLILSCFFIFGVEAKGDFEKRNPVVFSGTPTPYSVNGNLVQIFPNASVTLPSGKTLNLSFSGKGIRQKWIAVVKVNAYLAIHYLDNPALLNPNDPIESLNQAQSRMMILHMLQNVSSEDIRTEFEDALDVNSVNLNSPEIKSIREQTDYALNPGERAYLIGYHADEDPLEHIFIHTDKKTIEEKGTSLITDFWRVWLGLPVDAEMKTLKKALLSSSISF